MIRPHSSLERDVHVHLGSKSTRIDEQNPSTWLQHCKSSRSKGQTWATMRSSHFSPRCYALESAQPSTAKAHSPAPRTGSSQGARLPAVQLTTELAELLNCVPNQLLREIAQQALQATHATGAAIALEQQGELICRAAAGDSVSEIGALMNTGSGFTGLCASSGAMQLSGNTALDSRVDAAACRELGVSAIIVAPLLLQDRVLGLIAVFSRRPYAFGMRDLQALQDLAEKFTANLQLSAEPAKANTGRESPGVAASDPLGGAARNRKG